MGGDGLSSSRLAKSVAIIFIIGVISRVLGFFREMVLAAVFGASPVTDAYTITLSIPFVVFAAFGSAITTVVLPLLAQYRARGQMDDLERVAWTLFHALLLLLVVFLAVLMAGVDVVLRVFAPGFAGETFRLARELALILLPGILFMGINGWLQAVHNSARSFIAPAAVGIPLNFIMMAGTYFFGRWYGIEAVAWASLVAMASQVIVLWPGLKALGLTYRPVLDWRHPDLRLVLKRTGPVLLGTGAVQLSQIVDKALASGLPAGSAAALTFAQRLQGLPLGLITFPIINVVYPELATRIARGERRGFGAALNRGLRVLIFILAPVSAGLILLRIEVTRLVFERGAFDFHDTQLTAFALLFYMLGLAGYAWRELLSRAMYSMGDTWTPASTAAVAMGLNIALNLILVRFLAQGGIALAASVAMWWGALVLMVRIRRRVGQISYRAVGKGALQALAATAVMAVAVELARRFLFGDLARAALAGQPVGFMPLAVEVVALTAIGALVYAAVLRALGVEEWALVQDLVSRAVGQVGRILALLLSRGRRTAVEAREPGRGNATREPSPGAVRGSARGSVGSSASGFADGSAGDPGGGAATAPPRGSDRAAGPLANPHGGSASDSAGALGARPADDSSPGPQRDPATH
ncbi:murein biosynthesis integral membrane protein MurJ [Thermaerobacter sp. PB12/4term]|uniref:murein biosynthesis integral membrane protein MurJ n=1 Tax=Thermaerobacter sp. PB12/4term TaxID=2293838 RepID=UPI001FAC2E1B|nr:murein biosynthesis integral membrane protein MurJ [Thermaerobacter sp. PB12/4term]